MINKMSHEEIQGWIRYMLRSRVSTWFLETGDSIEWTEAARVRIPHSDINSAEEIYACFKDKIHYQPGSGSWYVWNGVFHEKIEGDLLARWMFKAYLVEHKAAIGMVRDHYKDIADTLAGDNRKNKLQEYSKYKFGEHRAYRDRIHGNGGITGLMNQIKGEFSVPDNYFSEDAQWLVFLNGVLDLYALRENPPMPGDIAGLVDRLLPHDPARPVWRCVNADLRVGAESPRWNQYLNTSLPNGELRKFLATVAGAAFMGQSKLKTIPVLKGRKDSGKTIFIDTLDQLAGGYGGQPDTAAINKVGGGGQNFEQDAFRGLRFVAVSEPDTDRKVDDSFLKKFTGGDTLSTRNLHARSVEWKSQGVLFFATNHDLKFNTSDKAILERFATVEFPHQFYDKVELPEGVSEEFLKDRSLEGALLEEMDGILTWVMNGALVYLYESGVYTPEAIRMYRVQQYVEGSTVIQWLQDIQAGDNVGIEWDSAAQVSECMSVADLHHEYVMWCAAEGEEPRGRKNFSREVQEYLGVQTARVRGTYRVPSLLSKAGLNF